MRQWLQLETLPVMHVPQLPCRHSAAIQIVVSFLYLNSGDCMAFVTWFPVRLHQGCPASLITPPKEWRGMHSQSGLLSNRTKLIVIYSDHLQKSCLMLGCFSIDASMVQLRLTVTWQKESLMLLSRRSRNFLHHGLVVYSKMLLQRNPFCIRACASRILDNWSRATWNLEMGYFLGFEFSPCHASFDVILFR